MLHAVCSVQTPKSARHGGTGRDSGSVGKGEGAEERDGKRVGVGVKEREEVRSREEMG